MRVNEVTAAAIAGGAAAFGAAETNHQLGITRVLIISLQDDSKRREHMRRQFQRFPGIHYEFFDAIRIRERSEYPQDYDTRARRRLFGDDLRPGEVGCYLSHRELWRQCAEAADDEVWCILEDDIVLLDDFPRRIRKLTEHRDKWDVVRLMELIPRRGSWTYTELDREHALRAYDRQPSGMQGYLLKPAAARRLLPHASRIVWPIDETLDLYWEHKLRLYTVTPAAVDLEPSFNSTIGQRSSKRRSKWRKLQREFINGAHGLQRKLFNLRRYGLSRRPLLADDETAPDLSGRHKGRSVQTATGQ
ncbi:glycosyltransferase family 25 protein [Cupriavidus sp. DB3]|uniref:glycosyltransferase family 25 protein n=1 Tax=Cupriavidus sp. DB3 TaxID=2873259 RepID=UPI001CF221E5|nr:glycosyltransferase family 25 protein [Cupriavidus sp. DB3]MCA7085862.1 glycosyltransferase family 25 protein [Cupriavidus sp. DB3]